MGECELTGVQVLNFWVPGHPKTKGSLQPRAKRCHCCPACKGYVGKPHLSDTEASKRWRKLVAYQAQVAMSRRTFEADDRAFPLEGPVSVGLEFVLDVESVIEHGAGDSDKLERNVLDALTDAGVYRDDVQVSGLSSWKMELGPAMQLLRGGPGVYIIVRI